MVDRFSPTDRLGLARGTLYLAVAVVVYLAWVALAATASTLFFRGVENELTPAMWRATDIAWAAGTVALLAVLYAIVRKTKLATLAAVSRALAFVVAALSILAVLVAALYTILTVRVSLGLQRLY